MNFTKFYNFVVLRSSNLKGIWAPLSGQIAQQQKVDTIANNIANANSAGFKKDDLVFREHLEALENPTNDLDIPRKDFSPQDVYRQDGAQRSGVSISGSFTDFSQGPLQESKNPLDLALQGPGFFEVLTPQGVRLTRKGIFTINQQGELVTENNYKLLKQANSDEPAENRIISRVPANTRLAINTGGEIYSNGMALSQISVVVPENKEFLRKEGSSLFYVPDTLPNKILRENNHTLVQQGFIEGSNVNAVQEMSELIKAHRQFDQLQRAIQSYDSINSKAVNDLMKF